MFTRAERLISLRNLRPKKKEGFMDKFEMAVFYNVQGPTLYFVGNVDRPDVYTVPFHSVNLSINLKVFAPNAFPLALSPTLIQTSQTARKSEANERTRQYPNP